MKRLQNLWWPSIFKLFIFTVFSLFIVLAMGCSDIERVSVDSIGQQGDYHSFSTSISEKGRFVAFGSMAENLVPNDTNYTSDIFVHDRLGGVTERVSVASNGDEPQNHDARLPAISADGRFVAFQSYAWNLIPNDTNSKADIFVHDRQSGITERVSVASGGDEANGCSTGAVISADGRFVAFWSSATNLVPNDTNGANDVFIRDRQGGVTERVSVASNGDDPNANGNSSWPAISADGQFVVFESSAWNLVANDTNNKADIFVYDRQSGVTERVSVASNGDEANEFSYNASVSADGLFVAFGSLAENLIPNDRNNKADIFVRNRQSGITERVSVASNDDEANDYSGGAAISADGRFVAFSSSADNLVPNDTNNSLDIFVHDRQIGITERVDVASNGNEANDCSGGAAISADGRFVAFSSSADNLVPNDTNNSDDVFVAPNPIFLYTGSN